MTFQAQVLAWTQAAGVDEHQVTSDLLVVPPVARVEPGASQIFRVALRRAPPRQQEMSYRLILEDVSAETAPAAAGGASVRLQVRHSLPVFVEPEQHAGPPHLEMLACDEHDPRACLRVNNPGAIHAKVLRIEAEGPGGWRREVAASATLLAGSWRQWEFEGAPRTGRLAIRAETTAGVMTTQVPLSQP
jgi:fimbrial chaperone protein